MVGISTGVSVDESIAVLIMRILVAEDNLVNRELLHHILVKLGHKVILAEDGEAAVREHRQVPADIILMDVWMPVMDGLAAARQIRKIEEGSGQRVPIIALTAHAIKGDREACLEAGMDVYMTKPLRRENLIETIARLASQLPSEMRQNEPPAVAEWEGVDAEILPRLGRMMVESCKESLAALKMSHSQCDWKGMARTAHTLRGSLGLFGARKSAATLSRLEKLLTDGAYELIHQILDELDHEMKAVTTEVTRRSQAEVEAEPSANPAQNGIPS